MGVIRDSAQRAGTALEDMRDSVRGGTGLIVGLLAVSAVLLAGILLTLIAKENA